MAYTPPIVLNKDFYKVDHARQYPEGTSMVYSNLTARGTHRPEDETVGGTIFFGLQYLIKEYLFRQWNATFFNRPRRDVLKEYQRVLDNALGGNNKAAVTRMGELHENQFLPLCVKALPEGTLVPYRIPSMTWRNTDDKFYWLTNDQETLFSNILWLPQTSATTAFGYRREFERGAKETGAPRDFIKWQGHDFSMRGMAGIEAACLSGAAHLLSFTGTDTIPAITFLETYYGAKGEKEIIGGSIPATEHSVMCMGLQAGEQETLRRLVTEVYPHGNVSVVSDTWNLWDVIHKFLPGLRAEILARTGKVVIRPDSGDPVKILLGDEGAEDYRAKLGVIRGLAEHFGTTTNDLAYKTLDQHVGAIYGDSITRQRQREILSGLKAMQYASDNVVLGIGSYTYQHVTRDTDGLAIKSTYGERRHKMGETEEVNAETGETTLVPVYAREHLSLSKKPVTDSGVKFSAKGLLKVDRHQGGQLQLIEDVSWDEEKTGLLQEVFVDGKLKRFQTLRDIRTIVEKQL